MTIADLFKGGHRLGHHHHHHRPFGGLVDKYHWSQLLGNVLQFQQQFQHPNYQQQNNNNYNNNNNNFNNNQQQVGGFIGPQGPPLATGGGGGGGGLLFGPHDAVHAFPAYADTTAPHVVHSYEHHIDIDNNNNQNQDNNQSHKHKGGHGGYSYKNDAAISALTLLAFLFFLNILQSLINNGNGNGNGNGGNGFIVMGTRQEAVQKQKLQHKTLDTTSDNDGSYELHGNSSNNRLT